MAQFKIRPVIDLNGPLPEIVKGIRKYKKTGEYVDEDGRKRCSKVPIVVKSRLLGMLLDW